MDNVNVGIVAFLAGSLVGSAATFLFLKNKFEDELNEQVSIAEKRYAITNKKPGEQNPETASQPIESPESYSLDEYIRKEKERKKGGEEDMLKHSDMVNYCGYSIDDEYTEELDYNINQEELNAPNGPIRISKEAYDNDYDGYESTTLLFYDEDYIVTDEVDELVDEPEKLLGDKFWHEFGHEFDNDADDPDTIYIHNGRVGTNYVVIRMHGSYRHIVLGE